MEVLFDYLQNNHELITRSIIQHLKISSLSVATAVLLGVPIGIFSTRYERLSTLLLNLIDTIYTIPSLALFGLMIPILGFGTFPALIVLVLYSLMPIVQNTNAGIKNINKSIIESANGMGIGKLRLLFTIELPLALTVILAGIRTALVNSIGLTTVAAYIGAGGLGVLVLRGISAVSVLLICIGSIPVILMSIAGDYLLKVVEERYSFKG